MIIVDKSFESEKVKAAKIALQEEMQGAGRVVFEGSSLQGKHSSEDVAKAAELLGYALEF